MELHLDCEPPPTESRSMATAYDFHDGGWTMATSGAMATAAVGGVLPRVLYRVTQKLCLD